MIEIKPINFGIASRVGNIIYMNKNLEKDVVLYLAIFSHELKHSFGYSLKDVKLDLRNFELKGLKWRYYRFILKNPSTWIEFLPFWVYEGHLIINPLIFMIYGLFLIIFGGILLLI